MNYTKKLLFLLLIILIQTISGCFLFDSENFSYHVFVIESSDDSNKAIINNEQLKINYFIDNSETKYYEGGPFGPREGPTGSGHTGFTV